MKNYESNCGGKRRGCCLIIPVSDSDTERMPFLVFGLSVGGSPVWAMVSKKYPKTPCKPRKTAR
jgi:hypothetical protein